MTVVYNNAGDDVCETTGWTVYFSLL